MSSNLPNYSNYPNGFTGGLTVRGMPILNSYPGQILWVDKNGAQSGDGTFIRPYLTIKQAIAVAQANRGDIIMVKAGHTETIADAVSLVLSTAGVAIIGMGTGSLRPTLTFSTANTANIPVTAKNCTIKNFLFVANFLDIASVFTATGTATPNDFCIEQCEFRDTSSVLDFAAIFTDNATANSCDGFTFIGNRISSLTTLAARTALKINNAAHDRISINDNFGNWAVLNDTACMLAAGANSHTNFEFARNKLNVPNTSSTGGSFISGSATAWTGHCYDNYLWQLDNTAGIWIATGTKLAFSNNFSPITGAADKNGLINPAAV
jgi:hypothetical protein